MPVSLLELVSVLQSYRTNWVLDDSFHPVSLHTYPPPPATESFLNYCKSQPVLFVSKCKFISGIRKLTVDPRSAFEVCAAAPGPPTHGRIVPSKS